MAITTSKESTLRSVKYIMRKYMPSLSKAMLSRNNHFSIASDLYSENVIPELIYSSMHSMDEPELVKVVSLITSIRKAVERDPDKFPVVLAAMKKHSPVDEVVAKIEKEYYFKEKLIVKIIMMFLFMLLTVTSGIIGYHLFISPEQQCTPVNKTDLTELVFNNLSAIPESSLRQAYDECFKLTLQTVSYEEVAVDCRKNETISTECFMRTVLTNWFLSGTEHETDGHDSSSNIKCWEYVIKLLQCFGQTDLGTHIVQHLKLLQH